MQRKNYQKEMEKVLGTFPEGEVPGLLLHSCCGPCSSAVLERLTPYFDITVYYYNPNIYPPEEYHMRAAEQKRLIGAMPHVHPVRFLEGEYRPEDFYAMAKGLEQEPEGGERCFRCYEQRLREAAAKAGELGLPYFATTLTLSPLKNTEKLNEIGLRVAEELGGAAWLPSDFKKKEGYRRSCELSEEYGMYRQDYCGCVYSLRRDFRPAQAAREKL